MSEESMGYHKVGWMKSVLDFFDRNAIILTVASVIISCCLLVVTIVLARYTALYYKKSVEIMEQSMLLSNRPNVYIREAKLSAGQTPDNANITDYQWILTNTGKLPATNVNIKMTVVEELTGSGENPAITTRRSATMDYPGEDVVVVKNIPVYPNQDLSFWIPKRVSWPEGTMRAQVRFAVSYRAEGLGAIGSPSIFNFIYTKTLGWKYVSPEVDLKQVD